MDSRFFTIVLLAVSVLFSVKAMSASKSSVNDDLVVSTEGKNLTVRKAHYYGPNTVIEFFDYPMYFSVEDSRGKKITNFRREGKYARIPGRHNYLLASVDGTSVVIKTTTPKKIVPKFQSNLPGYDFSYELSGDREAMPLQIFDDGKKTYMQFKSTQDQPAVFLELLEKAILLKLNSEPDSPYKNVDNIQSSYRFILGQYEATAKYVGNEKRKNTDPETTTKKSEADDLAKNIQADTPLFNSLHAKTTPDSNLVAKPMLVWTLDDNHTILQNLKNWANKAGWKIIWNLHHDWAVPASTRYTGEFSEAAGNVIKTLAANGALVRVKFYEGNKTMVVNGHGANAL